ncbi:uncharacterized protein LOC141642932 isoform X2 [Silene latifolia]|uniref:uncharacterized protein LOC141642932 isoform X2 n=1 Tax=Silene latifolia TaxID=37657 RepID=UPI003D78894E
MADAFNLLQMYQDDDDDDEMVPESHLPDHVEVRDSPLGGPDNSRIEDLNLNDVVTTTIQQPSATSTPKSTNLRPPTPEVGTTGTPGLDRRDKPAIVDYAHDDVAMSPDPQEGEFLGTRTGRVIFGEELGSMRDAEVQQRALIGNVQSMTPKDVVNSPQLSAQADVPRLDMVNNAVKDSDTEVRDGVDVSDEDSKDIDPLDKFLPPPPQEKCSDELQEKINKFLAYKRQGKSFNVEVRNRKDYRNPDFLRHAVRYQDIDEIGSCFSKDVFDPHGYDESDFYDAIEAAINRERERKEQERKKSQKVEFVSGTTQGGTVGVTPKAMLPSPGVSILPSGGSQSASAESIPREGRHNKKSKWDKVDGDRRSVLGGGHENVSAIGAHAALLSAANAGAGYAVYAQQKRREAEERRSSDRKADKRS